MEYSIKMEPEDFQVEEIPEIVEKLDSGKYTILKIRLKNWETNHFITYLSRYLGISRKRVTYAGTKDKRALTTQYFCLNAGIVQDEIRIKDCEILEKFYVNHPLNLGDLRGNRFTIRVFSNDDENYSRAWNRMNEISSRGAFWNFFGIQRFGMMRYNTHEVGRKIIKEGMESAVKEYLYDPEIDHDDFRIELGKTWDYARGLIQYPEHLQFERALMSELVAGKSYSEAFEALPKPLRIMFIHAYQSFLFNRILKERMNLSKNPLKIYDGDLVSPIDQLYNINEANIIEVNQFNLEKIQKMTVERKVTPLAPLIGMETRQQNGVPGNLITKVMEEENITFEDFRVREKSELSSKGNYRSIAFVPNEVVLKEENVFQFTLGKGIYATTFLDQVFKLD